ncbi:MAG: hypothetical protein EZS28_049187, partial [Streblomastix strix]
MNKEQEKKKELKTEETVNRVETNVIQKPSISEQLMHTNAIYRHRHIDTPEQLIKRENERIRKQKEQEQRRKEEDLKYFKGYVYVLVGQLLDLSNQNEDAESNFQFDVPFDPDQTKQRKLSIQVWEQNKDGEVELVGSVSIPILPYLDKFTEKEFDLEVKGEDYCYKTGKINISLIYTPEQILTKEEVQIVNEVISEDSDISDESEIEQ